MKGEMDGLAGVQGQPTARHTQIQLQSDRRGQHQPFRATACRDATVNMSKQRHDQTVFRSRRVRDVHLDRAGPAGDPSYQEMRHVPAEPMPAIVRPECEQIREPQ